MTDYKKVLNNLLCWAQKYIPIIYKMYIVLLIIGLLMPYWYTHRRIYILGFSFWADHLLHLSTYFGLCTLFLAKEYTRLNQIKTNSPFVKALWLYTIAIGTEAAQHVVPGRHASYKDLILNVLGVTLGLISMFFGKLILNVYLEFRKKRHQLRPEPFFTTGKKHYTEST
jgi:hypothetical protein